MTPDQRQQAINLIRLYRSDFPVFCRDQVKIVDKSGNVIPLILNPQQVILWREIERCIDAQIPVRIKILKARRLGLSTMISALSYWRIWGWKQYQGAIITQEVDASAGILKKIKFIDDHMPKSLKPVCKNTNKNELLFDLPDGTGQGSGIEVKTAGNPNSLRSSTKQLLHLSEVAFWPQARECALAALQVVDDQSPDTIVIYETTANGVGGYWYDFWYADNGFTPLFFGWQDFADYTLPAPAGFVPTESGSYGDEITEIDRLGLTIDQLYWRRETIKNKCGNSLSQFLQEYPGTPEDAFQSSGQCRFSLDGLRYVEAYGLLGDPIFEGHVDVRIVEGKDDEEPKKSIKVTAKVDKDKSLLRIWKPYEKRCQYVSFCDVSEGLTNDKGKTLDASSISVFKFETRDKVAEWTGWQEPGDVGRIEAYLGRAYGACIIVQEANNHGHAALLAVADIEGYPRELIFTHSNERYDNFNGKVRLGWVTTAHSREIIIDDLAAAINDNQLFDITRDDLKELYTFTGNRKGTKIKYEATSGCHDDRVIVMAMASHLLSNAGFINRYRKHTERWQFCAKCLHFGKDVCKKLKSRRDHDDCCRMFDLHVIQKFTKTDNDYESF